jgi:two-component system, LytTR family, sensor kinase
MPLDAPADRRPLWRAYLLSIAGWIGFGTLLNWQEHLFYMPDKPLWPDIVRGPWLQYGPHALLWPLVLRAAERLTARGRRWTHFCGLWLVVTLGFTALHGVVQWCFGGTGGRAGGPVPQFLPWLLEHIGRGVVFDGFVWAGLVGSAAALAQGRAAAAQTRQAAMLREELLRAQLTLLRSRLQPHFLFNALHAVAVVTHRSADQAERMLTLLGDLLRASLRERTRDLTSLEEELRLLAPYLELQQIRFQDRLQLRLDVPPALRRAAVPDLVLQPLVENALQHGIGQKAGPGTVTITAGRSGDRLLLSVGDDGVGPPPDANDGIGIGTTRARLQALFGAAATLELRARAGGGTEARIELPFREVTDD